jgi:hypothetical protein
MEKNKNKGDPVINFEFASKQNNLDFFKQIENKKVIISFYATTVALFVKWKWQNIKEITPY